MRKPSGFSSAPCRHEDVAGLVVAARGTYVVGELVRYITNSRARVVGGDVVVHLENGGGSSVTLGETRRDRASGNWGTRPGQY